MLKCLFLTSLFRVNGVGNSTFLPAVSAESACRCRRTRDTKRRDVLSKCKGGLVLLCDIVQHFGYVCITRHPDAGVHDHLPRSQLGHVSARGEGLLLVACFFPDCCLHALNCPRPFIWRHVASELQPSNLADTVVDLVFHTRMPPWRSLILQRQY